MSADIYPLDIPMYSPATASRLVGLSQGRVRRWLRGYEYDYIPTGEKTPQRRKQSPIVQRGKTTDPQYASFFDLIEMLFVKQCIDQGFFLPKLRLALEEAKNLLGRHHPFAKRRIWILDKDMYLKLEEGQAENMRQLLSGGQLAIRSVIEEVGHHIDFDYTTEFAERWHPLGKKEPVVIDPRISFGAPTITGHGIDTANIYDLYLGENRNITRVSSWMGLSEREVRAAIMYEETLAA